MKKTNKLWKVLMLVLALTLFASESIQIAYAAESVSTTVTAKNGWENVNGKYYYYVNGTKVKNAWKTIKQKKYYFGADGARKQNCWYTVLSKGKCYQFDTKGVWTGKYKTIDTTFVKKLDTVNKASKATSQTTNTKKLAKIALYLSNKNNYGYKSAIGFNPAKAATGWGKKLANEMLTTKAGSCYHQAAAFAYLAARATGLPVRLCYGKAKVITAGKEQNHGWVEVKISGVWYIYDTNAMAYSSITGKTWYHLKHSANEGKYYFTQKYMNITI